MSIAELPRDRRLWSSSLAPTPLPVAWPRPSRLEKLLPILTGLTLFLVDTGLIVGAFMAAYWVRFVASDSELAALGLDQYVRVGCTVALLTSGLFALRGL